MSGLRCPFHPISALHLSPGRRQKKAQSGLWKRAACVRNQVCRRTDSFPYPLFWTARLIGCMRRRDRSVTCRGRTYIAVSAVWFTGRSLWPCTRAMRSSNALGIPVRHGGCDALPCASSGKFMRRSGDVCPRAGEKVGAAVGCRPRLGHLSRA